MNSLSWMMYLADVAGSVSTVTTLIAVGAGIGGAATVISTAIKVDYDNIGSHEKTPCMSTGWNAGKGFFKVDIVAALVASVLPGKDTVYAIAASEMGENLINTPTAGKAVKALDAWLDRQIAGEAKPPEDGE